MDSPSHSPSDSGLHSFSVNDSGRNTRACDECRRRKVKCIRQGPGPCTKCAAALLYCTFYFPVQKKGPKPRRPPWAVTSAPPYPLLPQVTGESANERLEGRATSPRPSILSAESLEACADFFFSRIHSHMPIIDSQWMRDSIQVVDSDSEAFCMVLSMSAYAMLVGIDEGNLICEENSQGGHSLSMSLIDQIRETRQACHHATTAATSAIITATFLSCAYERITNAKLAWYYLREATTLVHTAGLHQEARCKQGDAAQRSRQRCLYWFLFVRERIHAFHEHRPVTLHATIDLPASHNCELDEQQLSGFLQLIALFKPLDAVFVSVCNQSDGSVSASSLARAQRQISDALPLVEFAADSQKAELRCLQAWLHVIVWQLALNNGLLSSCASNEAMTFHFPIKTACDLVRGLEWLSTEMTRVHGAPLTEKIFEVACCLIDVARCTLLYGSTGEEVPLQIMNSLVDTVARLPNGQTRYVPIIRSKLSEANVEGFSEPIASLIIPEFDPHPSPTTSLSASSGEFFIESSDFGGTDYYSDVSLSN